MATQNSLLHVHTSTDIYRKMTLSSRPVYSIYVVNNSVTTLLNAVTAFKDGCGQCKDMGSRPHTTLNYSVENISQKTELFFIHLFFFYLDNWCYCPNIHFLSGNSKYSWCLQDHILPWGNNITHVKTIPALQKSLAQNYPFHEEKLWKFYFWSVIWLIPTFMRWSPVVHW